MDELVTVSRGSGTEIIELVRRLIVAPPAAARWAEPRVESFEGRGMDDAVVIEHERA
ncbi:MAG TPA: hypothetical protein VF516_31815 [Kofleriaceae bacterium]